MKDPQKLRHEARGFLDKAKTTTDKTVRRVLLERALRLAQMAGMLEQAAGIWIRFSRKRDVVRWFYMIGGT